MHKMGSILLLLAASFVCAGNSSSRNATGPELRNYTQVEAKRVVIGSVADVSVRYENGKPITLIHILEFSTDLFPLLEPNLLQVRLCGAHSALEAAVHTNIALVYNLESHSRLTGCLSLISNQPWQDSSRWQTVTLTPTK
jgi:hypothetical protein